LQLWCAAAINITGSQTRDGGKMVGTSVFYSDVGDDFSLTSQPITDEVERLNQELQVCAGFNVKLSSVVINRIIIS